MRRRAAAVAITGAAALLPGCVALAVPVAASAVIGKKVSDKNGKPKKAKPAKAPRGQHLTVLPPGSQLPPPSGAAAAGSGGGVPAAMQFLYGSGEAAAIDIQAYRGLRNHLSAEARLRDLKIEPNSAVLARGATLDAPRFVPCGTKPLAVVFDVDETLLLNLGYEAEEASRGSTTFDDARWRQWEQTGAGQVRAVPGAVDTVDMARKAGITVVFNTNRNEATAAGTTEALRRAGLGEAKLGETLYLRAANTGGGKDERRWRIADRYCVVALVGDQLGDFSDLFNAPALAASSAARRVATFNGPIADEWGAGWFVLPNPVYGTALKGSMDEVFPPAVRWSSAP